METTERPLKTAGISCHWGWGGEDFKDNKTSGPIWRMERDINYNLYHALVNQLAAKHGGWGDSQGCPLDSPAVVKDLAHPGLCQHLLPSAH